MKAARNFANKIWNATRFIQMNLSDEITKIELPETLATEDKWVLTLYNDLVKEVTDNLEKFELGVASSKALRFHLGYPLRLVHRASKEPSAGGR